MPSLTIEYEDESQRLVIERALAMFAGLNRTTLETPHGTALAACESEAVARGPELTASASEGALRRRAVDAPQNGRPGRGRRGPVASSGSV